MEASDHSSTTPDCAPNTDTPNYTPATVRSAGAADVALLTHILATAFDDDPVINWVMRQDAKRRWAIQTFFRHSVERALRRAELSVTTDGTGGTVWWAPGAHSRPALRPWWRRLPQDLGNSRLTGPRRFRNLQDVGRILGERTPSRPHYHLNFLGVLPDHRGRGLGSTLIRDVTRRLDRAGLPAYLENTKERNLSLYERHGFRVLDSCGMPRGGPRLWFMWRDPQS